MPPSKIRWLGTFLLGLPIFLYAVFAGSTLEHNLNPLGRLFGDQPTDQLAATVQPSSVSQPIVEVETAASAKLAAASRSLSLVAAINNQITTKINQLAPTELKSLLVQRKVEMLTLAQNNPRLFLTQKLSPSTIQKILPNLRPNLEQAATLTGRLEVMHIDDFKQPQNSEFVYSLVVGNEKYALYPTEPIYSASGAVMKVDGFQLAEVIVAEAGKFQIITAAPKPEAVGDQKTLVLMIDFLDSGPRPFTNQQAQDLILNPNSQFQKFYKENSYNRVSFSGDVKGWYKLNRNRGDGIGGEECGNRVFIGNGDPETQNILRGISNLSSYDRLVFLFGRGGYCSEVGKILFNLDGIEYKMSVAWVEIYDITDSKNNLNHTLTHEIGHSLGVFHANGWDCGENVLRGDCHHEEYGNYFDTMGVGDHALHFNSFYKELLGWIPPSETVQINSSGRYTLNPLELASSGKKLAKVQSPLATSTTLYLEYRRGVGFDRKLNDPAVSSNQQGLFVNEIIDYFPRLLDMQPTTQTWYNDISLATLNSATTRFTDPGTGINLGPIIAANNSSITFDVEMTEPQCVRATTTIPFFSIPQLFPTPATHGFVPGGNGRADIFYHNGDSSTCGGSSFKVETSLPSTWQPTISPEDNMFLFPDSTSSLVSINFIVPINTPPGLSPITIDVINLKTNSRSSKIFQLQIVNPPSISGVAPQSGPVGTAITIFGANFSSSPRVSFTDPTTGNYFSKIATSNLGGNITNFIVPDYLYDPPQFQDSPPTTPGRYEISVYANGAQSDSVSFEVTSTSTTPITPGIVTPPETIPPTPLPVTVLAPNGGENWKLGAKQAISWLGNGPVNVSVMKTTVTSASMSYLIGKQITGSNFSWTVGQGSEAGVSVPVGSYRLKICSQNQALVCDESDAAFMIIK
ncbi:MAG: hypothetical protein AAB415_00785 [Patescibacteria group bacterium]